MKTKRKTNNTMPPKSKITLMFMKFFRGGLYDCCTPLLFCISNIVFFVFVEFVAYASSMEGNDLPITKERRKAEGKVRGKAAQAFNIPSDDDNVGYIMGNLILPPKGIKDLESVGLCAQTFTVCRCQSKAVEVAYGYPDEPDGELDPATAQRFRLGPGDMFHVPPGNCYRLENHSKMTDCLLTWTIIRPSSVPS